MTRAGGAARLLFAGLLSLSAVFLGVLVLSPPHREATTIKSAPATAIGLPGPESTPGSSPAPDASALAVATAPPPGIIATGIVIPRLGIDIPVVQGDGIDAPLDEAAHYPGTSWPGGGGNIYVYGHARQNIFQPLWDAEIGDRIFVELANGTERIYEVSEIHPDVPWDAMEVLDPTATEQLTLQTCTGTKDTDPRFLVIAIPVA